MEDSINMINKVQSENYIRSDNTTIFSNGEDAEESLGQSIGDKNRNRQRKNRELETLDDSKIINARLRSDSGKVYSTGLVLESSTQGASVLAAVSEEEDSADLPENMCLKGDCCKNTSKIIDMITKLQSSVDDVLKKTSTQEIITSNNSHKIDELEEACGKNSEEIDDLVGELKETKFQLRMVSNIVIKQDQQIDILKKKINEIQQREMGSNIVITGISESKAEKPMQQYNNFVAKELEIQQLIPANKAFRIGSGANRPMIVELRHPEDKRKLFGSATKLKGKVNESGSPFFIADHLPEEMNEERRRANELIAENRKQPASHRMDMSISRGKLIINEEPYQKSVHAPSARDLLKPDDDVIRIAKAVNIIKGDEVTKDRSQFGSFIAEAHSFEEVRAAYLKLRMKYSDATHVSCAYRLPGANTPNNQDYSDDGEFGCGRTMLKVLKSENISNVAIFMVRYYGGKHLGIRRYDIFRQLAEKATQALAKVKDSEDKTNASTLTENEQQQQLFPAVQPEWQAEEDWSNSKKSD